MTCTSSDKMEVKLKANQKRLNISIDKFYL